MNIQRVVDVINRKIESRDEKRGMISASSPDGVGVIIRTIRGDVFLTVREEGDWILFQSIEGGNRISLAKAELED